MERNSAENTWAVLVDTKSTMSWQFTLAAKLANSLLDCTRQTTASRSRDTGGTHLRCCVQCWAPQYKRNMDLTGEDSGTGRTDDWGHLSFEERLTAGIVHPGEKKAQGDQAGRTRCQQCPMTGLEVMGT